MASRFLTVTDNEALTIRIEFWEGLAFMHASFRRKVAGMRKARELFPQIKRWLREVGHEHCYVLIDPSDGKLHRFERHFGFRDLCLWMGFLVMAQEC